MTRFLGSLTGVLSLGLLLGACGTHKDSSDSPSKKSAAVVKAPKIMVARISKDKMTANPVDIAEFATIDTASGVSDNALLAAAFTRNTAFKMSTDTKQRTGGLGTAPTGPVQDGYYYGDCQRSCWGFPVLRALGGLFRAIVSVVVAPCDSGCGVEPMPCQTGCEVGQQGAWQSDTYMYNRAPVYQQGGYSWGYKYNRNFNDDNYRYYVYQGEVCGQGDTPGQWDGNGYCNIPGQGSGNCATGQYWNKGACTTEPYPGSTYCGTGLVMYQNSCYTPGAPANGACATNQVLYQNQCLASPVTPLTYQNQSGYNPLPGTTSGSCAQGQTWINGVCYVAAAAPATGQCPAGQVFYQNMCLANSPVSTTTVQ